MDIEYCTIAAECDVLMALGECYIKECLMELNGCETDIFTESDKPKKSLKERFLGWIEKIKMLLENIHQFLIRKWHKFTNKFKKGELVAVGHPNEYNEKFGLDQVKVQKEKFPHIKFDTYASPNLWHSNTNFMINKDVLKFLDEFQYNSADVYKPIDDFFDAMNNFLRFLDFKSFTDDRNRFEKNLADSTSTAKDACNDIITRLENLDISSTEDLKESYSYQWDFFDNPKYTTPFWLRETSKKIKKLDTDAFDDPLMKRVYQSYLEISGLYIKIRKLHSQKVDELFTMCNKELFELQKYLGEVGRFKKFKQDERENAKHWKNRPDQYDVDDDITLPDLKW